MWNDEEVRKLRNLQGARLREARQRAGFGSAEEAMRRYNWPSTYRSHENGTRGMGRKYREYAKKFKVNPAWLLGHDAERDSIVRGLKVIGDGQMGVWIDSTTEAQDQGLTNRVVVPVPGDDDMDDRFAIRVKDSSINKTIPQGAIAICEEIDEGASLEEFRVGEMLYIERLRDGLLERSFKRVAKVTATELQLSTYSADKRLKQDLAFPSARSGETIRLLGRVIGKYEDYIPV